MLQRIRRVLSSLPGRRARLQSKSVKTNICRRGSLRRSLACYYLPGERFSERLERERALVVLILYLQGRSEMEWLKLDPVAEALLGSSHLSNNMMERFVFRDKLGLNGLVCAEWSRFAGKRKKNQVDYAAAMGVMKGQFHVCV